jgi:hypothetical protein
MNNAYQRFGVLEYSKRTKDTTTRVRLRMDPFIGEVEGKRTGKAHLVSVLGSDSDVGAVWAGVNEQAHFTVAGPESSPLRWRSGRMHSAFGGPSPCRGANRSAISSPSPLTWRRPGTDLEGKRTVLCDDNPTFIFYRLLSASVCR